MKSKKPKVEKENPYQEYLDRIAGGELFIPLPKVENISEAEQLYKSQMMDLRPVVNGIYATMRLRISTGNIICATVRSKMGFEAGEKFTKKELAQAWFEFTKQPMSVPEDIDPEETEEELTLREKKEFAAFVLLKVIKEEYKRVTDGLVLLKKIPGGKKKKIADSEEKEEVIIPEVESNLYESQELYTLKRKVKALEVRKSTIISDEAELVMIDSYIALERLEKSQEYVLMNKLRKYGPEADWLLNINGVAARLTGFMLTYLNPYRARHASHYVSYSGLSVEPDGKATSRIKSHMVIREYIDKDGKTAYKESLKYSSKMKAKLLTCVKLNFIKSNSPYRDVFIEAKKKYIASGMDPVTQKGHIFNRAIRIVAKRFIIDFWLFHRPCHSLPVDPPYEVAKLGMFDHRAAVK